MDKVLFSSNKLDWETPPWLMNLINDDMWWPERTLDVCATAANTKCDEYMDKETDALTTTWPGGSAFCNPPYGKNISRWVRRAAHQTWKRNVFDTVVLLPSRTDTKYWHNYVMRASEVCFLRGRIRFLGAASSAPFPSCLVRFVRKPMHPVVRSVDIRPYMKEY